jgi:hypothetical protein
MDSPSVPAVLALLLCDQVITDAQTHKKSLIGVFQNVNSFSFPAPLKVALYAKLADAEGNYDLKVRVVRLKDDSLLYNFEIKGARVVTQLQPFELAFNMVGLVLPEPGKYEFQLYANDVYLSRITMDAVLIRQPGGPGWQAQNSPRKQ